MTLNENIIVIGGGVNGVTTAFTLQLFGINTTIYAEYLVDTNTPEDPRFASLYPAASVIPHSISSNHLNSIFPASLQIFKTLYENKFSHVNLHRHFELYEFPKDLPAYTRYLQNFSRITGSSELKIPRRPGANHLEGWVFDCYIAEWPAYMHQLYRLYQRAGGTIVQRKIIPDEIASLPADILINCSGAWSEQLFDDPAEQEFIRGHLVHVPDKPKLTLGNGKTCSYNYTPDPSIYATPQGDPSDVYFYPVNNKWILGGSRQQGTVDKDGQWQGKEHAETCSIEGVDVPRPIVKLNNAILKNTFCVEAGNKKEFSAYIGYRHSRKSTENGLRLEKTREYGKDIIHNYGHGGAGVTLSWGSALKLFAMMSSDIKGNIQDTVSHRAGILSRLRLLLRASYSDFIKTNS